MRTIARLCYSLSEFFHDLGLKAELIADIGKL